MTTAEPDRLGELTLSPDQLDRLAQRVADELARPLAVDVDGACRTLGVSWDFWKVHVAPEVRIVRRGRRKLVPVAELERWLADNATAVLDVKRDAA